ncbi:E3 ubiquitin-protein ligase XIAP-like [Haliotis rufescens]|uniref:E3 ubiquitin-protein ligase XIAP-like n=1 Tax=Haliotis rufescens TaxID=6454 RepID=UPI00201F5C6D|nr:E3 ubiquitin-protein ligase XIAP-like [Haliotis rufescens]
MEQRRSMNAMSSSRDVVTDSEWVSEKAREQEARKRSLLMDDTLLMDDRCRLGEVLERPFPSYTLCQPSHPHYDSFQERLRSFKTWPQQMTQTPYDMTMAGYFYPGRGDCVTCYCCGVALRQWEATDQPWKEHLKHAKVPCEYLCVFCPDGEVNEKYRRLVSQEARKRRVECLVHPK